MSNIWTQIKRKFELVKSLHPASNFELNVNQKQSKKHGTVHMQ